MKKEDCNMEETPNIAGGETGICRFCGQMVNVQ